jgi:hypothetical protein
MTVAEERAVAHIAGQDVFYIIGIAHVPESVGGRLNRVRADLGTWPRMASGNCV